MSLEPESPFFKVMRLLNCTRSSLPAQRAFVLGLSLLALPPQEEPKTTRYELGTDHFGSIDTSIAAENFPERPDVFGAERPTRSAAGWRAWAQWLDDAHTAEPGSDRAAAARAWLVLFALDQGRSADAWRHLAAVRERTGWCAELLPHFLPGLPVHAGAADVLRPALPPPTDIVGPIRKRVFSVHDMPFRNRRLSMTLTLEPAGVELFIEKQGGEPLELAITLTEPPQRTIRSLYVEWSRQEHAAGPHTIKLEEDSSGITVYGRTLGREPAWPSAAAHNLPRSLAHGGLWLEATADDPDRARLTAIAEAIGGLIGVTGGVRPSGTGPGQAVTLGTGLDRERKLAWLAGATEAFLLEQGKPRADSNTDR